MDQYVTIAAAITLAYAGRAIYRSRFPSLPGPPGYPIVGNIMQMGKFPQYSLTRWYKQYGDVFTLQMGAVTWAVVNTPESLRELLVQKASITSSRPRQHVIGHVLNYGHRNLVVAPYGDKWKWMRGMFTQALTKSAVASYAPTLSYEGAKLAKSLVDLSEASNGQGLPALMQIKYYTLNGLLGNIFGCRMDTRTDPRSNELLLVYEDIFGLSSHERYAIEFFPFLRPIFPFISRIPNIRDKRDKIITEMVDEMRDRLADPAEDVPDCMARRVIEAFDQGDIDELDCHSTIATVIAAGTDTLASLLHWFTIMMSKHPDVQEKIHAEMDREIGRERPPTHQDMESLRYLRWTLKELARIRSPGFLNVPHLAEEDIVYKDRLIKKGTWIMVNFYAFAFDESKFDDAHAFRPERWEERERSLCSDATGPQDQRDIWFFGAGKRMCVGMHLAEMEVFLGIANIIWASTIGIGQGEHVDITETRPGLTMHAAPRRLTFTPRFPEVSQVLSETIGA